MQHPTIPISSVVSRRGALAVLSLCTALSAAPVRADKSECAALVRSFGALASHAAPGIRLYYKASGGSVRARYAEGHQTVFMRRDFSEQIASTAAAGKWYFELSLEPLVEPVRSAPSSLRGVATEVVPLIASPLYGRAAFAISAGGVLQYALLNRATGEGTLVDVDVTDCIKTGSWSLPAAYFPSLPATALVLPTLIISGRRSYEAPGDPVEAFTLVLYPAIQELP